MKRRSEIRQAIADQIQKLLESSGAVTAFEVLDVVALQILMTSEYLAGTCSREQAVQAMKDIIKHIETSQNLPKIKFKGRLH